MRSDRRHPGPASRCRAGPRRRRAASRRTTCASWCAPPPPRGPRTRRSPCRSRRTRRGAAARRAATAPGSASTSSHTTSPSSSSAATCTTSISPQPVTHGHGALQCPAVRRRVARAVGRCPAGCRRWRRPSAGRRGTAVRSHSSRTAPDVWAICRTTPWCCSQHECGGQAAAGERLHDTGTGRPRRGRGHRHRSVPSSP